MDKLTSGSFFKSNLSYNNVSDNFFEEKIKQHISSLLPLITIEQLKIIKIPNNFQQDINLGSSEKLTKSKDNPENITNYINEEIPQFHINEEITNSPNYYLDQYSDKFSSLNLDNTNKNYYLSKSNVDNTFTDEKLKSSLYELIEKEKINKFQVFENNDIEFLSNNRNLKIFHSIDNSLDNLLTDLSYKVNHELYNSNLIENIISEDNFKYLIQKNIFLKHPSPFVIKFDIDRHALLKKQSKLPSFCLFNITIIELEYKNLYLSIQRNKINELKNQFQILTKKEGYWRQKEEILNKILRKS